MKLIKNAGGLRDLAIVYLTRSNGSVHDSVEPFETALAEASPVIAALFTGPNEGLRTQIAVYLDAIQSHLAHVFQEGIARDDAIAKERQAAAATEPAGRDGAVLSMEGLAKRVAAVGLGGTERQQRS
jgi:hypothetical protein